MLALASKSSGLALANIADFQSIYLTTGATIFRRH
jgi:hypothetical protein